MCFSDSFALVAKINGKIDKSLSKMIDAFDDASIAALPKVVLGDWCGRRAISYIPFLRYFIASIRNIYQHTTQHENQLNQPFVPTLLCQGKVFSSVAVICNYIVRVFSYAQWIPANPRKKPSVQTPKIGPTVGWKLGEKFIYQVD